MAMIDTDIPESLSKARMKAARKAARRAARAEKRANMTPEATAESFERTEQERRERQRKVINGAWTRALGSTQETTLTALDDNNEPVKTAINISLLGASKEASLFWTSVFGTERFARPAALTVTDIDLNGRSQQRRIMVEPRPIGDHTYPFPGEQTVINRDSDYGTVYQAGH